MLELTKAAEPASVLPGQLITFTLTADTSGNDARGVLLTDTLPAGLTLVSAPSECTAVNPVVCTIPGACCACCGCCCPARPSCPGCCPLH